MPGPSDRRLRRGRLQQVTFCACSSTISFMLASIRSMLRVRALVLCDCPLVVGYDARRPRDRITHRCSRRGQPVTTQLPASVTDGFWNFQRRSAESGSGSSGATIRASSRAPSFLVVGVRARGNVPLANAHLSGETADCFASSSTSALFGRLGQRVGSLTL